jgi:hypothetical protein
VRINCRWEHIGRSDLLYETKGINFFLCPNKAEMMSNGWEQTFTNVIPKIEGVQELRTAYAGKRGVKAERDEPWKCRSLENDYVKAFACETCSDIASARATAHDKDLSVLLRVRR